MFSDPFSIESLSKKLRKRISAGEASPSSCAAFLRVQNWSVLFCFVLFSSSGRVSLVSVRRRRSNLIGQSSKQAPTVVRIETFSNRAAHTYFSTSDTFNTNMIDDKFKIGLQAKVTIVNNANSLLSKHILFSLHK